MLTSAAATGAAIARTKLVNGAQTIAALPNGWVRSGSITYNLADGKFTGPTEPSLYVGSLSSVFGLIEVMTECVPLVDDENAARQLDDDELVVQPERPSSEQHEARSSRIVKICSSEGTS
ncbi:hypothetical protein ACFYWS_25555 [Streptomyces sp. NPDC002795]|uniref:exo-rhamnogalacturonan lyase family protein n=1 Tax=Streptomyces sp. NPDC002795 TaxID=3364665 RepID=UPI00367C2817